MRKLPNFLIIGVPKAGTTSLYYWLKQHPEVYMSPIKEPHYFSQIGNKDHITDWDDYLRLFEGVKDEKIIGEASTSYFHFHEKAIPLIKNKLGKNVKLLLILRNPIERAWSHWLMYCKYGIVNYKDDPLKVNLLGSSASWGVKNPILTYSYYSESLEVWLREFGNNLKVMLFDDLRKEPLDFFKEVLLFLDIDVSFDPQLEIRNVSGKPRNWFVEKILSMHTVQSIIPLIPTFIKIPLRAFLLRKEEIPNEVKRKLKDIYYEDILKTSKLLNKDLSFWMEI